MSKKCTLCGTINIDDAMFCAECGSKFSSSAVKATKVICSFCGAENFPEDQFCAKCGKIINSRNKFPEDLVDTDNVVSQIDNLKNNTHDKKNSKLIIIIGLSVVVLALICIIIGLLIKNQRNNNIPGPETTMESSFIPVADDESFAEDAITQSSDEVSESIVKDSIFDDADYHVSYNTPSHAGINLRGDSSSNSELYAVLKEGTAIQRSSLPEYNRDGYTFVRIKGTGVTGWMMTRYIAPGDGIAETLPAEAIDTVDTYVSPRIISAETLFGTVLPSSNVSNARTFGADKAIDGNIESCWCVNTETEGGIGARIKFVLEPGSHVTGIAFVNGNQYLPGDGIYDSNGQICDFNLSFSDGSSIQLAADFDGGNGFWQEIDLPVEKITDYIILTVDSSYLGSKYKSNVCLGEFDVY